jgi:hypothetical protein
MLSTIAETVDWKIMKRKVYSAESNSMVVMSYLRLNLIDQYNNFMNSVDLADQLRNCYRFNHWLRNRKWWWSLFLWALGVAATNGYKIYDRLYEEEKKKKKSLPPKWTHLQFLEELIHDFMGWETKFEMANDNNDTASAAASTRQGSVYSAVDDSVASRYFYNIADDEGREEYFKSNQAQRISKKRMESGYFNSRFNGQFHPHIPVPGHNAFCQSCKYFTSVDNKKRIERCVICQVNLCWRCRLTWHGVGMEEVNKMLSQVW